MGDHSSRPLLVVDGDSFAHRAHHGLPKSIRRRGNRGAGAIVGFANFLLRLYETERPRAVLVAWDTLDVPTYRHRAFAGYQRASPGVACPPDAKPAPSRRVWNSVNQNWLKRCRARPVGLFNEFDRRVKTEIPDKLSHSTWYKKSVRSGSFGSLGMDPQRSHPLLSSIIKGGYER
jgi:hypothetical protein